MMISIMFNLQSHSNLPAKSAQILGHTVSGMGERTLALKFSHALKAAGYRVAPIVDILEFLGADYEPMATLNYGLADANSPLLDDLRPPPHLEASDLLLILSWSFSVAALYGTGVHKGCPTAVKLYAHHPNERILSRLYEPADLVITESLLGNERAYRYGIDKGKVLYLPHSYPSKYENLIPSRAYVERLGFEQCKPVSKKTRIIGCVCRLEYGKNCEWAVEAVRLLAAEGHDVVLVLKGDFPDHSPYPDYKPLFSKMLQAYCNEPWLLWDPKPTPYPQVLEEYGAFDVLLHPSGAEGASHLVVECLGILKPVVLLDCSTNPYLFKGLATFVKPAPEIRPAQVPFFVPNMSALCKALIGKLWPPDTQKVRERFHESHLQARMPLLFEREPKILSELYREDCKRYDL